MSDQLVSSEEIRRREAFKDFSQTAKLFVECLAKNDQDEAAKHSRKLKELRGAVGEGTPDTEEALLKYFKDELGDCYNIEDTDELDDGPISNQEETQYLSLRERRKLERKLSNKRKKGEFICVKNRKGTYSVLIVLLTISITYHICFVFLQKAIEQS